VDLGNRRTAAITEALVDAPDERRDSLLRAADKQPVIVRELKADKKVPEGDQPALWSEV
jgi:hypothetical protein